MNFPMDLDARIARLLSTAGTGGVLKSIAPLSAGGNNRSYRIQSSAGEFVVKRYFQHAGDDRDRMGNEFAFLTYAAIAAPGIAPKALSCDPDAALALYEYIPGQPVKAGEITRNHVEAAAGFFKALNDPKCRPQARLSSASEACFSIDAHLRLIDQRLEKLSMLDRRVPEDSDARDLVDSIIKRWATIKHAIHAGTDTAGINDATDLPPEQRCISPSDFGFHNALKLADGKIKFLDFEYAGWDDPAKMAGDFFAQLAVPVPGEYFNEFVSLCLDSFPDSQKLIERARLLRPAYQVKWCCIALNVFLPVNLARRKFANPNIDERALKREQLTKATQLFQTILSSDHGLH